jgi:hypothetical protein
MTEKEVIHKKGAFHFSALQFVRLEISRASTQRAGWQSEGCSRKRGLL